MFTSMQDRTTTTLTSRVERNRKKEGMQKYLRSHFYKHALLIIFTAVLFFGSLMVSQGELPTAQPANPGPGNVCVWYTVHWGDTLGGIAGRYGSSVWTLARANSIRNVNLIFVGQRLC